MTIRAEFSQARAIIAASTFWVMARDRAQREHDRNRYESARHAMRIYEHAATWLHPGLQIVSTDEPERTLIGIGSDKVQVRYGAAAAVLALTLSTGCALDVNGTGPAPSVDAGGAPTVAVVEPRIDAGNARMSDAEATADAGKPMPMPLANTCQAFCEGCCDEEGRCQSGTTTEVCGSHGRICVNCAVYGAHCGSNTVDGFGFCSTDPVVGKDGGT